MIQKVEREGRPLYSLTEVEAHLLESLLLFLTGLLEVALLLLQVQQLLWKPTEISLSTTNTIQQQNTMTECIIFAITTDSLVILS